MGEEAQIFYEQTNEPLEIAMYRTRSVDLTFDKDEIYSKRISRHDDDNISDTRGASLVAMVMSMERSFSYGYIGLGCAETNDGDVICIIPGSEVPFLLRPEEGRRYTFVGECYVHGFVDVKGFDNLRERVGVSCIIDFWTLILRNSGIRIM